MGSLADLYSFQALVWMCINAAMQRYAVLRLDGDGISVLMWSILAVDGSSIQEGVYRYPFEC
jgi:hypothetical protein